MNTCHCKICHAAQPAVCRKCIHKNIEIFRNRRQAAQSSKDRYAETIETALRNKPVSTTELTGKVLNIRREVEYTKSLVAKEAQRALDHLRDNVNRRKAEIEQVHTRLLRDTQAVSQKVKLQSKTKRKEWKALSSDMVKERRRLVARLLSLYRVAFHQNGLSTVGGISMPVLFQFKDFSSEHINCVVGMVAHIVYLIARYLGVRLPYRILLARASSPDACIETSINKEPVILRLSDEVKVFADAFACLTINLHTLIYRQTSSDPSHDFAEMLLNLCNSSTLGSVSDATAYVVEEKPDNHAGLLIAENRDLLAGRIADDINNDVYEIIDHEMEISGRL